MGADSYYKQRDFEVSASPEEPNVRSARRRSAREHKTFWEGAVGIP